MPQIDYFFSTLSSYSYLAGTRLEQIAVRHGAAVTYRPLDIAALYARTGGKPVDERHPSRQEYRAQDLVRVAARLGLPFNVKALWRGTNGAPAAYAISAAQKAGGGDMGALCHGVLRACWAEERDIADDAVIRSCLSAAGFDPDLAHKGIFSGADGYERNLEEALARGVFGAPFYIVAQTDQRFWGQDRLDDLDAHLASLA